MKVFHEDHARITRLVPSSHLDEAPVHHYTTQHLRLGASRLDVLQVLLSDLRTATRRNTSTACPHRARSVLPGSEGRKAHSYVLPLLGDVGKHSLTRGHTPYVSLLEGHCAKSADCSPACCSRATGAQHRRTEGPQLQSRTATASTCACTRPCSSQHPVLHLPLQPPPPALEYAPCSSSPGPLSGLCSMEQTG